MQLPQVSLVISSFKTQVIRYKIKVHMGDSV